MSRKIGKTLPPGAQSILRAMGVWDSFLSSGPIAAYGTASAWGGPEVEANEFIFHPDRRGWHIDRARFDAMLVAEAERQGIEVRHHTPLLDFRRSDESWTVTVRRGDGRLQSFDARFAVDATGRAAQLAMRLGAVRSADDRLVAVVMTYRLPPGRPMHDTYALVEAWPDGWWYSALQPDGRLVVACFTDADIARAQHLKEPTTWNAALQAAPHTWQRAQCADPDEPLSLRIADTGILDRLTGGAWLATGDAASTFDPLSSQGILKAIRQGTIAAYAVVDHLAGDEDALPKYAALHRREYDEFLEVKRDFYRRENRWRDNPFWARRHQTPARIPSGMALTEQLA